MSQNSKTFNILLQSYDKNTGAYQIDKQEIIETSWNEFFNYIRNLPSITSNQPISPKIISEDFIISRESNGRYLINWNYESKFYWTIPKNLRNGIKVDFHELERSPELIFNNLKENIIDIQKRIKFENYFILILIILNSIIIILVLFRFSLNLSHYIILIWFLICYSIGITYLIRYTFDKNYHKIKINYSELILEEIHSKNGTILIFIILFIILNIETNLLLLNYGIPLGAVISLSTLILLVTALYSIVRILIRNKKKKNRIINYLNRMIQTNNDFEKKNYFKHQLDNVKNQKIIDQSLFYKLILFLSFIQSLFLPFLLLNL